MALVPYPANVGVDWGSIDDNKRINLVEAHAAGVRFIGRKTSEHTLPDPQFAQDWQAAKTAGLVRMPYHFPRVGAGRASAAAQVAVAKTALDAAGGLAADDLPFCLDVEFPSGRLPDSRAVCAAAIIALAQEFRQVYGYWPVIYSSARVVDGTDLDALAGQLGAAISMCPLWVKTAYRLAAGRDVDQIQPGAPKIPVAWTKGATAGAWIRQIQGDAINVPGFSSTVDVSLFLTMYPGETSARVTWVQTLTGAPITGVFDDATAVAVRKFQTNQGLVSDAVVGLATFARLARLNV